MTQGSIHGRLWHLHQLLPEAWFTQWSVYILPGLCVFSHGSLNTQFPLKSGAIRPNSGKQELLKEHGQSLSTALGKKRKAGPPYGSCVTFGKLLHLSKFSAQYPKECKDSSVISVCSWCVPGKHQLITLLLSNSPTVILCLSALPGKLLWVLGLTNNMLMVPGQQEVNHKTHSEKQATITLNKKDIYIYSSGYKRPHKI